MKVKGWKVTKLPVLFLKEGRKFIAYTPVLDLSTCGDTLKQAKERFEEILKVFIDEIIQMGTLETVLNECGWRKVSRQWVPPVLVGREQQEVNIPLPV